ncbi:hypothetical protein KJ656_16790 [bacterium]|nr:hypothetical protein [bacterium]
MKKGEIELIMFDGFVPRDLFEIKSDYLPDLLRRKQAGMCHLNHVRSRMKNRVGKSSGLTRSFVASVSTSLRRTSRFPHDDIKGRSRMTTKHVILE